MASRKKNVVPSNDAAPSKSSKVQRKVPTTSLRWRKCIGQTRQQSEAIDELESTFHQSDAQETTQVVEGCGPFPGGPTDASVLLSYEHHVVVALWGKPKHRVDLKCINHGRSIKTWDIACHPKKDPKKDDITENPTCFGHCSFLEVYYKLYVYMRL
ncbi:hypothetical protein Scep_014552 [Stephania cephalantha]|uniref:Uncharacterized protein n=1 Tax=Stephania cephalantha TaxID=152367 RepID=A0AAP0J1E9_9MAGN